MPFYNKFIDNIRFWLWFYK